MNKLMKTLLVTGLTISPMFASAEIAVIVNPANAADVTSAEVSRLFLAKQKAFSNGDSVNVIAQSESTSATSEFNDKVLGKSASQLKSYWSKLIFTGKGTPPNALADDAAVKSAVASDANAIGYVDVASVDGTVKVIFTM